MHGTTKVVIEAQCDALPELNIAKYKENNEIYLEKEICAFSHILDINQKRHAFTYVDT